jgi:4-diphosphocytidyl-2-C-methyl-D-erythritol kinase
MHARPRAKVNLTLSVGPRRHDGLHPLSSVFLRIGLADELNVAFGSGAGDDVLTVGGLEGCPVKGNLVLRAFGAARRALGHSLPPLVAHLDKRIPMDAGLGGGSADAASAVDCALQMWGAGLAPDRLAEVSLELGSDVPFFARNLGAALVSGRGEVIERLPVPPDIGLLLVTPPIDLSTAAVYARFDELSDGEERPAPEVPDLSGLAEAAGALREANDLWPAVVSLAPGLGLLRDELETRTGRPWLLSGSGSTLFAVYPSSTMAADAGRSLAAAEADALGGAMINAVDLVGPDPVWRYPWPSEQ